jgi:asparagine synthase (glutamine-hydrolysing)
MPGCVRADAPKSARDDHRDVGGTTMCGIFAAMTRHGLSSDRCDAALKLLEHRGPDGTGIWTSRDGQWTLGHTRLSIIGLRNGSQPMTSPDGAVHVVVNGEFYGYRELREDLRARGLPLRHRQR